MDILETALISAAEVRKFGRLFHCEAGIKSAIQTAEQVPTEWVRVYDSNVEIFAFGGDFKIRISG